MSLNKETKPNCFRRKLKNKANKLSKLCKTFDSPWYIFIIKEKVFFFKYKERKLVQLDSLTQSYLKLQSILSLFFVKWITVISLLVLLDCKHQLTQSPNRSPIPSLPLPHSTIRDSVSVKYNFIRKCIFLCVYSPIPSSMCRMWLLVNLLSIVKLFRIQIFPSPRLVTLSRQPNPYYLCYIITEWFFLYYHFLLVISYHSVWLGLELFDLVHIQVHTLSAGVHARARRMWQSQML